MCIYDGPLTSLRPPFPITNSFTFLAWLKGHFCSQIRFFFKFLIPYLGIILRPPMFLESPFSTSNLPKSWKMYLRRYLPIRQPVLAKTQTGPILGYVPSPVFNKSPTGIGQIAFKIIWRHVRYICIRYILLYSIADISYNIPYNLNYLETHEILREMV